MTKLKPFIYAGDLNFDGVVYHEVKVVIKAKTADEAYNKLASMSFNKLKKVLILEDKE